MYASRRQIKIQNDLDHTYLRRALNQRVGEGLGGLLMFSRILGKAQIDARVDFVGKFSGSVV